MEAASVEKIVAYCGLVCNDCGAFKKNRCGGCYCEKPMNMGCKVKPCAVDRGYGTCAECCDFDEFADCKKLNNFISRIFAFIFKSNRIGNLKRIRQIGLDEFKREI